MDRSNGEISLDPVLDLVWCVQGDRDLDCRHFLVGGCQDRDRGDLEREEVTLRMIITKERLVKIKAIDWGFWDSSDGYELTEGSFKPYIGWLYGQVIIETDEYIVLAAEAFEDKRVRKVTSVPKSAVIEIIEFERKEHPKESKSVGPENTKLKSFESPQVMSNDHVKNSGTQPNVPCLHGVIVSRSQQNESVMEIQCPVCNHTGHKMLVYRSRKDRSLRIRCMNLQCNADFRLELENEI